MALQARNGVVLGARTALPSGRPGATIRGSAPHAFGQDANYAAFPGLCQVGNGDLVMVYRQGTDHVSSHDGDIYATRSKDLGRTWSAPSIIVAGTHGTVDMRDPSLFYDAQTAQTYLTYFKENSSSTPTGSFVRISTDNGATWGSEITISSTGMSWSACTAPLVRVSSSTLMAVLYGIASGDSWNSVWVSTSTNNGTTWGTPTRVANGQTAGWDYNEAWPVVNGSTVTLYHRYKTSTGIATTTSTNSGSTWGSPTVLISSGYSGRTSAVLLSSGETLVQCRSTVDGSGWFFRISPTGSVYPPQAMLGTNTPNSSTAWCYGAPIELAYGTVLCAVGLEETWTSAKSRIYLISFMLGAGTSTLGDSFPTEFEAVNDDLDQIVFAESFKGYTSGSSLNPVWTTSSGTWTVNASGVLVKSGTTIGAAVVDVRSLDVDLVADLMNTQNTGVSLMCRYTDDNNHIRLAAETPSGTGATGGATFVRIYSIVSGTATKMAELNLWIANNAWHRFTLTTRGYTVSATVDGVSIPYVSIGQLAANPSGTFAGVRFDQASNAGAVGSCRKFVARV